MRSLRLEIQCGKTTCAESPGSMCRYVRSRMDGSRPWCAIYDEPLMDPDGWLMRCSQCLADDEEGT